MRTLHDEIKDYIICTSRSVLTYVQNEVSLSFDDHLHDFTVDTIITNHIYVRESHFNILIIYISSLQMHDK
jgi:hypothetical protein